MSPANADPATVDRCLRLGAGFAAQEHDHVVSLLSSLDTRLKTFPAESTELELTAKERERPGQTITLECRVAGRAHVVTSSSESDLAAALMEVRDHVRRQLDDAKARREPQNYRKGHATVRRTSTD